ncbi:hypothetical protein [Paraburkholderia sp. BL17N1]|nr:hypothetical protein [Paraburkholderia sp. BL17N1]RKR38570.1 hypothetical protein B0G82_6714 [Paraburkholderia sp. BL17N1]
MADRFVTLFDLYRASPSFSLQMLRFSHETRQQACDAKQGEPHVG